MTDAERIDALERRMAELEAILQGNGSYVSKYSGEEIDALLDKLSTQQ